ncbi:MAG: four helix bundle protein [Deltaproteobacteria bacterium]|nr:four helix bundle protein [Deltaproteobacteria bacterium]
MRNLDRCELQGGKQGEKQGRFKNKIAICESESSETKYWLEVMSEMEWMNWNEIKPVYDECGELLAIFVSIGKKC